jgi:hypothetical protein
MLTVHRDWRYMKIKGLYSAPMDGIEGLNFIFFVLSQARTVVSVKIKIFWDVTACNLVDG